VVSTLAGADPAVRADTKAITPARVSATASPLDSMSAFLVNWHQEGATMSCALWRKIVCGIAVIDR